MNTIMCKQYTHYTDLFEVSHEINAVGDLVRRCRYSLDRTVAPSRKLCENLSVKTEYPRAPKVCCKLILYRQISSFRKLLCSH